MKAVNRNKGFTLVELVVSILMYSLILILFTTTVLAFTRMYEIAAKIDDVANDAETIYNVIDRAYKASSDCSVENHRITIDGVEYYFDRTNRAFMKDNRAILINTDIVSLYIYDYTQLRNNYEFRVVYYKGGVLNELYFILANFKGE